MGHLLTKMSISWLEQDKATQNKPIIAKRKRTDHDNISNKRKSTTKNDNDDDGECVSLSPRLPPIIPKITKSYNRSLSSITLFKCQLCRRYLKNKDIYMDHMILCAIQRQASIKIVRANKDKNEDSIL